MCLQLKFLSYCTYPNLSYQFTIIFFLLIAKLPKLISKQFVPLKKTVKLWNDLNT